MADFHKAVRALYNNVVTVNENTAFDVMNTTEYFVWPTLIIMH